MKRPLLAFAAAILIAAALAPTASAADEAVTVAPGPTPVAEPTPTPFDGNGEIVIDPTFITSTPEPSATPAGDVRGATGRPQTTPPPTDTISATTMSGTGLQVLLVLAVAGSFLALFVGRGPAERRR